MFGFVVGLAVNAAVVAGLYWFGRTIIRRYYGTLRAANPFQAGWAQLLDQYESSHGVLRMVPFSARIGGIWYNDILHIGFDAQDVVIRNNMGFSSLVRIPYSHIELLQPPESFQATRLSETEYTPGLFQVGMVEVGLDAYWTAQFLQRIAAASSTS
ncbi:hypothetical protein [Hymenobacter metallilatus]|uniref:Uncharacterized protein n=1 Tax=Hymenobacter metallilatus TaxID=2493666 RepID=A0A3R9M552_9BACT|nr:hypothetical protein [Hymenobacter metallilatus]RSK37373.1 hypothetical protein EI290_01600 [Hymenobacter metallilatus]